MNASALALRDRLGVGGSVTGSPSPLKKSFHWRQVPIRGSVYHLAVRVKTGTVTGTIPGAGHLVPRNDTAQMRTHGRVAMYRTIRISVNRYFFKAVPQYGALTGGNVVF